MLQALTLSPNNSMIFQNLGGAFASQGKDHQTYRNVGLTSLREGRTLTTPEDVSEPWW